MKFEDFKKIHCNSDCQSEDEMKTSYFKFKISELKAKLYETDYKAIKYAEGLISEEDYMPIKNDRKIYRQEINEYEELIKKIESK